MIGELEKFLREDLALALANIRFYLDTSPGELSDVTPEARKKRISSYLTALENRAIELSIPLSSSAQAIDRRPGVLSAIERLERSSAA
jgi:hypothetical protein